MEYIRSDGKVIPIIEYDSSMGEYSRKTAEEIRIRLNENNSMNQQIELYGVRISEDTENNYPENIKCKRLETLSDYLDGGNIKALIVDKYFTLVGLKYFGQFLMLGNPYREEEMLQDFFGIPVYEKIYELVYLSDVKEKNKCVNCRENGRNFNCNPWGLFDISVYSFGKIPNAWSIHWQIVEQSDEKVLLLSRHGVMAVPFVDPDLRQWLNTVFLETFFTQKERTVIASVRIPCADEIKRWFPEESERTCRSIRYPSDNRGGKHPYISKETCVYWLSDTGRRPGKSASVVMAGGKIYKSAYMAADNVYVRPLIEINREEFYR